MKIHTSATAILACAAITLTGAAALASNGSSQGTLTGSALSSACSGLPTQAQLKSALTMARYDSNGGFNLDMWATVVNRDGIVCAVAFTGADRGSQWPGSRVISAQKANTANAFSLPALALSTADLWAAVQPGGTLYGLATQQSRQHGCGLPGPGLGLRHAR
jgi:hypothetical protein